MKLLKSLIYYSVTPSIIDSLRQEALKKVEKKQLEREVLVLTYHPGLPSVTSVVKSHWDVMCGQSNRLKRCFQKPSMIAYRRPKNLRDILVKAKVSNRTSARTNKQNGFNLCPRSCRCCILGERATKHSCAQTGKTWKITSPISCKTKNVIYKLSCRICPSFVYIGETSRRFCDRFAEHRGYVSQKKLDKPIGEHFNREGHKITDLVPLPIERVLPLTDNFLRKRREKLWIYRYDSASHGANTRD